MRGCGLRLADIGYESFEQVLELEPPDMSALTQLAGTEEKRATRSTNVDELYVQEFQLINSKVYDVIHPSLLFVGPYEEEDLDTVRTFRKGAIKNGVGLLAWVLQWTRTDSFEVQSFLREHDPGARSRSRNDRLPLGEPTGRVATDQPMRSS